MPVRYISRLLIRFLHLVFSPPLPFIFAFPSFFLSFPTGKISYLKTQLSLFARFPLLRFLPSHNRIHFYRHTHRLAFNTYFRTSSVFLSARPAFEKSSVSERNHTRRLQSEPFRLFSKSKLADKEVIDCVVSPKGKVRDALQECKASSSCLAPPFLANRARTDITEKSFGNSPALLRFTKPPKQHYSNNSCSESEYCYGL